MQPGADIRVDFAAHYARACLAGLGHADLAPVMPAPGLSPEAAWADTGLNALSGWPDGDPLSCPVPLASQADGVMAAFNALLPEGRRVEWLGRRVLGMRRLSHPLKRGGTLSAGGSCRLLRCADAHLAVNLARDEDWSLLPAWLECEGPDDWEALARAVRRRRAALLVQRAGELGLAVARDAPPRPCPHWFHVEHVGQRRPRQPQAPVRVLDFSSLWAGPLCTQLLVQAGCEVTRIEHPARPDGARFGPQGFFRVLDQGKRHRALDLGLADQRQDVLDLLATTDIVVEAFRPRVWEQFGVSPQALVESHPGLTWVSITGYGRQGEAATRVAFGDDAAVAAGLTSLMAARHGQRVFCGDAIADPLTGLHAALAAWSTHRQGGGRLLSVPLVDVVGHCIDFARRSGGGACA